MLRSYHVDVVWGCARWMSIAWDLVCARFYDAKASSVLFNLRLASVLKRNLTLKQNNRLRRAVLSVKYEVQTVNCLLSENFPWIEYRFAIFKEGRLCFTQTHLIWPSLPFHGRLFGIILSEQQDPLLACIIVFFQGWRFLSYEVLFLHTSLQSDDCDLVWPFYEGNFLPFYHRYSI